MLDLEYREYGNGLPLLILHGVFGSSSNWQSIAKALAHKRHVFSLDLRNHGRSPHDDAMSYPQMAKDVAWFIERHQLPAPDLLGHSMGGKVAMTLALQQPERVRSLVVVDIAPVAYGARFQTIHRALRSLDPKAFGNRAQADAALARSILDKATRAFLLQNLVKTDAGFSWRINLPAIIRASGQIHGFPKLGGRIYNGPALFLRGSESNYVEVDHGAAIKRLFPRAEIQTVAGGSHWLHYEKPGETLGELNDFWNRHEL